MSLYIAPGGPPPLDKPLPWNFHCSYMNDGLLGKEVHIDSREPLEEGWWKAYPDILRLEIHGDLRADLTPSGILPNWMNWSLTTARL